MSTATYSISKATTETRDGRKALIGRRAVFTTWEGERLEGVIEAPIAGPGGSGFYPVIRFADGRWGRCDDSVELVNN